MNLYNKPKIEWNGLNITRFMGTCIWIECAKKLSGTIYYGMVALRLEDDGVPFTDPYTDKEKCRAAIEKKCQDLIVQSCVGIELILPPWEGPIDDERWKGINEGLKEANRYMQKQGHITILNSKG